MCLWKWVGDSMLGGEKVSLSCGNVMNGLNDYWDSHPGYARSNSSEHIKYVGEVVFPEVLWTY